MQIGVNAMALMATKCFKPGLKPFSVHEVTVQVKHVGYKRQCAVSDSNLTSEEDRTNKELS